MSKASIEIEESRRNHSRRDFLEIMESAIQEFKPVKRFVLFSGGNDSTGLLHRAWSAGMCDAAVHINTGIGIEETRHFVRRYCEELGVPLIEKTPPVRPTRVSCLRMDSLVREPTGSCISTSSNGRSNS